MSEVNAGSTAIERLKQAAAGNRWGQCGLDLLFEVFPVKGDSAFLNSDVGLIDAILAEFSSSLAEMRPLTKTPELGWRIAGTASDLQVQRKILNALGERARPLPEAEESSFIAALVDAEAEYLAVSALLLTVVGDLIPGAGTLPDKSGILDRARAAHCASRASFRELAGLLHRLMQGELGGYSASQGQELNNLLIMSAELGRLIEEKAGGNNSVSELVAQSMGIDGGK